ncbi:hypothetical protein AVEN_92803-1, partial [Araneus ventricosus]
VTLHGDPKESLLSIYPPEISLDNKKCDPKESLLSIYPPEILPEEFGGTMGNLKDIQPICMDEMKKAVPKLTVKQVLPASVRDLKFFVT